MSQPPISEDIPVISNHSISKREATKMPLWEPCSPRSVHIGDLQAP
jgi:hypothetical protein